MTAFLDIDGLTKRHGGRAALDDVSLSVEAGEFVALVGPSGSGKTTLLKSINRLVEPDEGDDPHRRRATCARCRSPSCATASAM